MHPRLLISMLVGAALIQTVNQTSAGEVVEAVANKASDVATKTDRAIRHGARVAGEAINHGVKKTGEVVHKGAKKIGLPTAAASKPAASEDQTSR